MYSDIKYDTLIDTDSDSLSDIYAAISSGSALHDLELVEGGQERQNEKEL